MKRARTASALVLALGMAGALTACSQDSDDTTESAPTTATSSAAAPTTAAPVASETAPPAPPAPAAPVLGPDGFGALKMGMSRAEAEASGVVEPFVDEPRSACESRSQLNGAPGDASPAAPQLSSGIVNVSSTLGVVTIDAYPGVQTPEGIGIGSPVTAVDQAYPDWNPSDHLLRGAAPVPGNDTAVYRIAFDRTGTVTEVTLQHVRQPCYE